MNHPNLFIVGAPKCGTTALSNYLASNANIYLGRVKEPNYWSSDLPFFAKREGFDCESRYLKMYQNVPQNTKYFLDASTHYLFSSVAIPRIVVTYPNAKFIVCLRPQDKLATAWHMQMYNAGYESISDFEKAWSLRLNRRNGNNIPSQCPEPHLLDYEAIACVGEQLQRMFLTVDLTSVHVVFLSDIQRDVKKVYDECLEFLELPSDDKANFPVENAAFVNRFAYFSHLVRKPFFRRYMNKTWGWIGPKMTSRLKGALKRSLYKKADRKPLRPEFQEEIKKTFTEDDKLLTKLLGRSLYSDHNGYK